MSNPTAYAVKLEFLVANTLTLRTYKNYVVFFECKVLESQEEKTG